MKHLALACSLFSFSVSTAAFAEVYGKFQDEKKSSEGLAQVLSAKKTETTLMVHGKVEQICEKKGCWMILQESGQSVRVKFKGYSFFVGKNLLGKNVKAEGVLHKKTQSVAEQKHFLEDGGASKEEIEKIKEPLETYTFEANAVTTI